MFSLVWIMPPRVMTRSAGRPVAKSRGRGKGVWIGKGGSGRGPKRGNDKRVDELNGQGNDQGLGTNRGIEGVNGNVEGVNEGAPDFSMIIAQQLQNLLPAMLAQVGNQGNVGNQNGVNAASEEVSTAELVSTAYRRLEVKARSTLMIGIPNEHQLKFNSIKDAKQLLEAVEKEICSEMLDQTFDRLQKLMSQLELLGEKLSQEDVNQKLLRYLSPKWNTHAGVWRNKADLDTMSMDDLYKTSSQPNSPQLAHEDLQQIHPDDMEEMDLRWQMAMLTIRARRFLKNTGMKLTINGNETIGFDRSKVECYNCHKRGHFARESFVSCDGLGGYDWSDQAEKGPNYALMAFSSSSSNSEVSNDSICLKAVEERLEFYKTNESIYLEDIKGLRVEIHIGEITIRELRKKLEIAQKEKDGIQLNVDKFENASKSLNKLIECQIVDNCKKGLGYNTVPPPYTGNFMPTKPDLYFTGLDEFVNKPIVENCKAMSSKEEAKAVRKNDDAPNIEEWVSDDEEEDVS
ncbi:ribonuclease H-like domain-containing protein [Tanacetum coccineum]